MNLYLIKILCVSSWRAQTKPVYTRTQEKRAVTPTRDRARLACECPGVSGQGVGQQWPAVGSGALITATLGGTVCWHKCFCPFEGLRSNYRERHSPNHQQKIGWKIYWAWIKYLFAHQSKTQFFPQTVPQVLSLKTPWTVWKGKKIWQQKMDSAVW